MNFKHMNKKLLLPMVPLLFSAGILKEQLGIRLYAPLQAVTGLRLVAGEQDGPVLDY